MISDCTKSLLLSITILTGTLLHAQDSVEMRIKPRMKIEEVIPFRKLYVYPQFTAGIVGLNEGGFVSALLDYNLLLQEMQFINDLGDTLALSDESGVKFVVIKSDTFLYNKGFYQVIQTFDNVKLAKRQDLHIADIQKKGANDFPYSAGAIDTYNHQFGATGYNLLSSQDVILGEGIRYYISVDENNFVQALKKNLYDGFDERHSNEIMKYIKDQNVNLNKEPDLIILCKFLSSL